METVEQKSLTRSGFMIRIVVIVIGAIISAYGITLAIGAGYGSATLAVLWQGVAHTFSVSLGISSGVIAAIMIIVVFFYDRKQIHVGTFLYQIIYSFFVDVFGGLHRYPANAYINFGVMVIGIVIFAVGTGMYASAKLGRGSYEAVTFAIAEKNHFSIRIVRIISDIVIVFIGFLLGGKIGVCTCVTILLSGPMIQASNKISSALFRFR